jgi:purine catabolism regulator
MTQVSDTPQITVEDMRKLALPVETRVVAGDGLLAQPVNWITLVNVGESVSLPTNIQPGEIILVALPPETSPPDIDLSIIRWASDHQAAAVVMSVTVSPTAIAEANAYGLPILSLPSGVSIRSVERDIVSLLVDRKGQVEQRGTSIYRQLTEISSRNEGISELVNAIARLTSKSIVVQDKRLRIIHNTVQPGLVAHWDEIENSIRKVGSLPVDLQDRHRVSEISEPVIMQSLSAPALARLVAPIITKDIGRGYLSIIGHENDFDDIDTVVAEHSAAAVALEMAKAKAISDTEKRLRGTFLDRLLTGDVSQQEAVRQGERFEHDMTLMHVAIVLKWQGEKTPSTRRLETLVNGVVTAQRAKALVWQREKEQEVLVFHATEAEEPIKNAKRLAETFTSEVQGQYPNTRIAIGLGQAARDISAWRNSYRDAAQALDLAIRLQTDAPLYIGDLGVYQLILSLTDKDKLVEFKEQTLGKLEEYDMRQRADLIITLEAFFACHGNLSQTAEMLIVHRNTLLYRMNRINQIAQIDLNRPETRLALHLALTIRRLMMLN